MNKKALLSIVTLLPVLTLNDLFAQIGIWTSASELAIKPMSGLAWAAVKWAADDADPNGANVSNQDSNNNVQILAAAITYARTGDERYKNKVVDACEKLIHAGKPDDRTLAWARETGAYALAADLAGYRTRPFEIWLRDMAENYVATDSRTLLSMFKLRPNNWGTQGFGSLCAIYAFLQDTTRLTEVRNYWIQSVIGPKPAELTYGDDLSWHVDPNNLRLINPKDSMKQGLNIDGIIPDDMRRGAPFKNPPEPTGYAWETLQGIISAARILDRMGMPIWDVADSAIYRAVYALQVRWQNEFGGWKAEGDDLWMLPFIDDAYGTNWAEGQPDRVWEHGKNAGWAYVVWEGNTAVKESGRTPAPIDYDLSQNYPNPFNSTTKIRCHLPQFSFVRLTIFDMLGRTAAVLCDRFCQAGNYIYTWDTADAEGRQWPTGIYWCRLEAGTHMDIIKMILTR